MITFAVSLLQIFQRFSETFSKKNPGKKKERQKNRLEALNVGFAARARARAVRNRIRRDVENRIRIEIIKVGTRIS